MSSLGATEAVRKRIGMYVPPDYDKAVATFAVDAAEPIIRAERDAQIAEALRAQVGEYADRGAMEAADFIERWAKENP